MGTTMSRAMTKLRKIAFVIEHGAFREIVNTIKRKLYSDTLSYCLRRDLTIPFDMPEAKIPITVRPLIENDIPILLDVDDPSLAGDQIGERMARRLHLNADIPTCYVAVTADDKPCYMQWLMGSSHNDQIESFFNGIFPRLAPDEALLENAFTSESYRGQRIMPCAMAQIAEKAVDLGARGVITFVMHDNIPSLKGCKRAGFLPHMMRRERRRFFRQQVTFTPLPPGTPYPFDQDQEQPDRTARDAASGSTQDRGAYINT